MPARQVEEETHPSSSVSPLLIVKEKKERHFFFRFSGGVMRKGVIYVYQNVCNGKRYVGQTVDLVQRRADHKRLSLTGQNQCPAFYKAIRKYGFDNFLFSVVCECDSAEDLNWAERFFIELFQTRNPDYGYNISEGGMNFILTPLHPRYEELRQLASENSKKNWSDPEVRERIQQGLKKYFNQDHVREYISERNSALWEAPEYRAWRLERFKTDEQRPPMSEEQKAKIAISVSKLSDDPEYRRRQHESRSKEEYKLKTSLAIREYISAHPERLEEMSQNSKEYWTRPGYRTKKTQDVKQQWGDPDYRKSLLTSILHPSRLRMESEINKILEQAEITGPALRRLYDVPTTDITSSFLKKMLRHDLIKLVSKSRGSYPAVYVPTGKRIEGDFLCYQ